MTPMRANIVRAAAVLGHQDQRFHRGLPLRRIVFGFREFGDVGAGVFQSDELATARQVVSDHRSGGPGQSFSQLTECSF
jgi:hypothetical protein